MAVITEQKLKHIVKESVREALSTELMKLRALAVPEVFNKEQRNIDRLYKKPSRRAAKTVTIDV